MIKNLDEVLKRKMYKLFTEGYTAKEAHKELNKEGIDVTIEFCVSMFKKFHEDEVKAKLIKSNSGQEIKFSSMSKSLSSSNKSIKIHIKL